MVTEDKPTRIMRVTTLQTQLVTETTSVGATLYENYLFENNNSNKYSLHQPQILRYHMMTTQPGQVEVCTSDGTTTCDATCRAAAGCQEPASMNLDYAKAVLWDLRVKDKVLEWPLKDCGDGVVNITAFE